MKFPVVPLRAPEELNLIEHEHESLRTIQKLLSNDNCSTITSLNHLGR